MAYGIEVQTVAQLDEALAAGVDPARLRLQDLDLRSRADVLRARPNLRGMVVLGGRLTAELYDHLRAAGALVFPDDADAAPVTPYRSTLYRAEDLYAGLERGYAATLDARAYRWALSGARHPDVFSTLLRAIHDDSITDALDEFIAGRPVVGLMGGHALARDSPGYAAAARLACALAGHGLLVATGGGPGAMEAVNLGAACPDEAVLAEALTHVTPVPDFARDVDAWARSAFDALAVVRRARRTASGPAGPAALGTVGGSIGIPTWFYGHEPPNVFGDAIAKYFSNALREDGLLARATAGVVVLPGAAGTVQEVFQAATRSYYAIGTPVPLVLVGRAHWTEDVPVWPALHALGRDRAMARVTRLVDSIEEALAVIAGS